MTFSLLSSPQTAGIGDRGEQTPQDLTPPPFPSPRHKHALLFSPRSRHRAAPRARGLSSSSAASLQGLTGTVPPSPALPHRRFLRLSGLARPRQALPRWGRGRRGAARGPFSLLRPCNGVRRLFRKHGPSTGARRGPPGQPSEPTRQRGSRASLPFPSRGSPSLLPPPPPARRHLVRSRCDTDTIVGPERTGEAREPHATGSRLAAPTPPKAAVLPMPTRLTAGSHLRPTQFSTQPPVPTPKELPPPESCTHARLSSLCEPSSAPGACVPPAPRSPRGARKEPQEPGPERERSRAGRLGSALCWPPPRRRLCLLCSGPVQILRNLEDLCCLASAKPPRPFLPSVTPRTGYHNALYG